MHSDPMTTVTDSQGRYAFHNVPYTNHELIVKTPEDEKIAEFTLAFLEGDEFSTDLTDKGVSITYTGSTETVNIVVEVTQDQSSAAISQVSDSDNPSTDDSSGGIGSVLVWIGGGTVATMLIALLIIILINKKKDDSKELI